MLTLCRHYVEIRTVNVHAEESWFLYQDTYFKSLPLLFFNSKDFFSGNLLYKKSFQPSDPKNIIPVFNVLRQGEKLMLSDYSTLIILSKEIVYSCCDSGEVEPPIGFNLHFSDG